MLLRPKTGLNDMIIELTPGHADGRARRPRATRVPIREHAAERQPRGVLRGLRPRHARLPRSCCCPAAARASRARARTCRPCCAGSSRPNRDIQAVTQGGRQAAQEPRAAGPQLPAARDRARQARQGAGGVGRLHRARCSSRSPTRSRTCARRSGSCPARSSRPTRRSSARTRSRATSVRRRATCCRARRRSPRRRVSRRSSSARRSSRSETRSGRSRATSSRRSRRCARPTQTSPP